MEIKNQTAGSADLYFYGDICSSSWDAWQREDMCPQDVADFLNNLNGVKNINIYINSGGGDSFAGAAIYNILKRSGAHMDVHVDALAASSASAIAMVGCLDGNTLHMPPGTQIMIHDAWTIAMGNANDFEKLASSLRKCDQAYSEIYAENAIDGVTAEQFIALQDAETWMDGAMAAQYFKNIDISGVQVAASLSTEFLSRYKNVPKSLIEPQKPAEPTPSEPNHDEENKAILAKAKAKAILALSK